MLQPDPIDEVGDPKHQRHHHHHVPDREVVVPRATFTCQDSWFTPL